MLFIFHQFITAQHPISGFSVRYDGNSHFGLQPEKTEISYFSLETVKRMESFLGNKIRPSIDIRSEYAERL